MMELLSDLIWIEHLSEYLIKSTLVFAFAILLAYLCRKQSASLRHFILSVSLIGLLFFPLLSTVHSGWKTGLLPSWKKETKISLALDVAASSQSVKTKTVSAESALQDSQIHGRLSAIQSSWSRIADTRFLNLMRSSLIIIWLSGLIFIFVRQMFGLYGAYKLTIEAEDLKSSFWLHLLDRFLETISVKRKVDLLQHKKVMIPLTWGWLHPVVILPDSSKSWTGEQRESALYHELSHVKRGDFLVMMLARMSLGLYWFNPLSWVVFQWMKKEQEKACDELVLKTGIKPSTYAANLLSIRRSMQMSWNPPGAVVGAMGRSQLNERLLAILKQKFKIKEVKMRTKIFFSVLVILAITFLGMARPSPASHAAEKASIEDVLIPENLHEDVAIQEEQEKKKDKVKTEKADKEEDKGKKKDVFVWHMEEGEEGEVEVIITDEGKTKSFTLKEPVIIIKKDDSGKEIAITSSGKAIDIKKDNQGIWIAKGDAVTLHEHMETLDLGEGSVIMLKTSTKDGHKIIEIKAPVVVVKKSENASRHITVKVSDEAGKRKAVVVSPRVRVEQPDIHIQVKENELKKIHEKLQKIHEKLSKEMESKTEEEEQALKDMEETLKTLKKELEDMKNKMREINLSIHEEPHRIQLEHDHAISIEHKSDKEEGEKDLIYITKDKGHLMSFVDEEGESTFLAQMKLEKAQKQSFADAVKELEQNLPEGYDIESKFDDESGRATIKIKGSAKNKDTKDVVIDLLKELKEKLATKN